MNWSALCDLGLLPRIRLSRNAEVNAVTLKYDEHVKLPLTGSETENDWITERCPKKKGKCGDNNMIRLTTGPLEERVINWGHSLLPSIELDIHKWI